MSRGGGSERIIRLAHRWLGIGALSFVLLSLVTGLLWAGAKFLYWGRTDSVDESVGLSVVDLSACKGAAFEIGHVGRRYVAIFRPLDWRTKGDSSPVLHVRRVMVRWRFLAPGV